MTNLFHACHNSDYLLQGDPLRIELLGQTVGTCKKFLKDLARFCGASLAGRERENYLFAALPSEPPVSIGHCWDRGGVFPGLPARVSFLLWGWRGSPFAPLSWVRVIGQGSRFSRFSDKPRADVELNHSFSRHLSDLWPSPPLSR